MVEAEGEKRKYHSSSWFGGTGSYYSYAPLASWLLVTDGIKETCEGLRCWWVVDIIASLGKLLLECGDWFRAAKVHLGVETECQFFLEDGNGNVLYKQDIAFTDLKEDLMFFLEFDGSNWVALMPEEH